MENKNYIQGLICGVALIFLNSSIVMDTINSICTLFDPTRINNSFCLIMAQVFSRTVILLSFIGIFVTIFYSFLILKSLVKKNN